MNDPIISPRVLAMVEGERLKQDSEWGGHIHDDLHTAEDWCAYILHQIDRMGEDRERHSKFTLSAAENQAIDRRRAWSFQERMIKIAALAIAAAESSRRQFDPN